MTIERLFDVQFIAQLALREKQIQQNYRPIIAVHKWFARRPGTLFRGLLLAEYQSAPLRESFWSSNDLSGRVIADPFMGGGTPLVEANRLGCDIIGYDINPMSYWIVRQEIEHLDLKAYRTAAATLIRELRHEIGMLYETRCPRCSQSAHVKYFLWVCVQDCSACGEPIDLFPGYLVAEDVRHPRNVLVCRGCGDLNEVESRDTPGACGSCGHALSTAGPAQRNKCLCSSCGSVNRYPDPASGPPRYRMFAIEFHCAGCKPGHTGRFFKRPDANDLSAYDRAVATCASIEARFVPGDAIPAGDETDRLHRWGYRYYRQTFNPRQLLGLELSCRLVSRIEDERVRNALATNLSDLLRYQNMLCRYDTMALKSLDIFSVHGFPVGLVRCESNLLGIGVDGRANVGSGGWSNIADKYARAKEYCDHPFEVRQEGGRKSRVYTTSEWIGDTGGGGTRKKPRRVTLRGQSATEAEIKPGSLDGVFTDPPYLGSVQYAELMDYCYVWLRKLVGAGDSCFNAQSTRHADELTRNYTMERGHTHFAEGLTAVFKGMATALKHGAPLVFTYHHNMLDAYLPVGVAILDAGLTCTASLPCPAEMGASIHINGTGSSVVDTVFVCRASGAMRRDWLAETGADVAHLVAADVAELRAAGLKPSPGDIRCIAYGHLVRLAVWRLRLSWDGNSPTSAKLDILAKTINEIGSLEAIRAHMEEGTAVAAAVTQSDLFREEMATYHIAADDLPF